ncbi:UNVERIFIED_ORG: hypothetical protein ABID57_000698 [Arthrobacter sp. UYEF1]
MATIKQRKAAEIMVGNGGNASRAMREAGYSPATAENPDKLTGSKGFAELLEELGLTDDLLIKALVEDIKAKPGDRKPELELGFKVRGRMTDKKEITGKDGGAIAFVDMASDDGEG